MMPAAAVLTVENVDALMSTAESEDEWEYLRDVVVREIGGGELPAWWWPLYENPCGGLHGKLARTWTPKEERS